MASIDGVIYRGEDDVINLAITNPGGAARNITTDSLSFIIKYKASDTTAISTKTVGAGITKTNSVGGLADVALSNTDLVSLADSGSLACALKITDASSKVTIIPFDLKFEVTAGG